MADTADLIVLGAYYGTGTKGKSVCLFVRPSVCLSVRPSHHLSICLSVHLFYCLSLQVD